MKPITQSLATVNLHAISLLSYNSYLRLYFEVGKAEHRSLSPHCLGLLYFMSEDVYAFLPLTCTVGLCSSRETCSVITARWRCYAKRDYATISRLSVRPYVCGVQVYTPITQGGIRRK